MSEWLKKEQQTICCLQEGYNSQARWLTSVIPVTSRWEGPLSIGVQDQPKQHSETPISTQQQQKTQNKKEANYKYKDIDRLKINE